MDYPSPSAASASPLALCSPSLALRAVLGVQAVVGVGLLLVPHGVDRATPWPAMLGPAVVVSLVATLVWLVCACAVSRALGAAPTGRQRLALASAGTLAALVGVAPLSLLDLLQISAVQAVGLALGGAMGGLVATLWLETQARDRSRAAAQARVAELQARIRPHFLFNTLNSALALLRQDSSRAEAVLEDLSELFRAALEAPVAEFITLEQELDLARRYLAIEAVRFGGRMRVTWNVDASALGAPVPPLILQPLVENAVRHGIEPALRGGDVEVSVQRRAGRVTVDISNSVDAYSGGRSGHGMALANVRERLLLLHDLDAHFEAGLTPHGRFRVSLSLPPGSDRASSRTEKP